ncbi:unnamed protein product [Didymodactylos carnosus]|uniref:Uncharacterized protein n=1 Tax=Didymodactylos carnosus TaxID=1234261 RepID=A0A8S2DHC4_9BILA|nr:unnamed protein product [Didymodactylos carnosus]CAF3740507.1 unnamed protein product [Didymodactylos carnosus]
MLYCDLNLAIGLLILYYTGSYLSVPNVEATSNGRQQSRRRRQSLSTNLGSMSNANNPYRNPDQQQPGMGGPSANSLKYSDSSNKYLQESYAYPNAGKVLTV